MFFQDRRYRFEFRCKSSCRYCCRVFLIYFPPLGVIILDIPCKSINVECFFTYGCLRTEYLFHTIGEVSRSKEIKIISHIISKSVYACGLYIYSRFFGFLFSRLEEYLVALFDNGKILLARVRYPIIEIVHARYDILLFLFTYV